MNEPYADRASPWFVTSGLLVREMVDGNVQTGNATFETRSPAQKTVAGDAVAVNVAACPTYASFTYLTWTRADNVWTAWLAHGYATKHADVGNRNMDLTDNQGRRYDHVEVGGDAARDVLLQDGQSARG